MKWKNIVFMIRYDLFTLFFNYNKTIQYFFW
jgi:hypothetical protein